jgi:tRNA (cytidine/uridine-2'-O-)-methyltransferase
VDALHHPAFWVQERGINGKAHEERVDAVARHNVETVPLLERPVAKQPYQPFAKGLGPRRPRRQLFIPGGVQDAVEHWASVMLPLLSAPLHLVLVAPQIPPNTGNIARLCAVTGAKLLLVEPLGFSLSDRHLRRAGLDYWDQVCVGVYRSYADYLADFVGAPRALFTARSGQALFDYPFRLGHHLVFGSETEGLGDALLRGGSGEAVSIPMLPQRRSLNLSTAAGIATYEALRQLSAKLPPQ